MNDPAITAPTTTLYVLPAKVSDIQDEEDTMFTGMIWDETNLHFPEIANLHDNTGH